MSKILIIVLILLVLVVGVIWKTRQPNAKTGSYEKITAEAAFSMMQEQQDLVIVDVRTPGEYADGHIQGAINVSLTVD